MNNLKNIKSAIFDVDGTLLDSMYIWTNTAEMFLKRRGITPDENLTEDFITMSLEEGATFFKNAYNPPETVEEIMMDINKMVEDFYFKDVITKPFVKEFLEKLKNAGIKMCIATATDKYLIEKALERNGIAHYFSEIFTCTIVGAGKTPATIYEEALKHLGTSKDDTLIFEDAHYAIKTAKNAGFKIAAIEDICEAKKKDEIMNMSDFYITDYKTALNLF